MTGPSHDCPVCRRTSAPVLPPRERIVLTPHWRVAHAFDSALPGWLVVVPLEHLHALDELPAGALAELGPLLGALTSGLRTVVGCEKTYVGLYAEAEGFSHLHLHVVPRMPDQPADRRGPASFGYLGADDASRVSDADMDALSERLAAVVRPQIGSGPVR